MDMKEGIVAELKAQGYEDSQIITNVQQVMHQHFQQS